MHFDSVHRDSLYTDGDEDLQVEVARIRLGSAGDDPEIWILRMGAGFEIPPHAHDSHRCEIVLAGSLQSDDEMLDPGGMMFAGPGECYGPLRAGPDGAITLEFFADAEGALRIQFNEAIAGDLQEKLEARGVEVG